MTSTPEHPMRIPRVTLGHLVAVVALVALLYAIVGGVERRRLAAIRETWAARARWHRDAAERCLAGRRAILPLIGSIHAMADLERRAQRHLEAAELLERMAGPGLGGFEFREATIWDEARRDDERAQDRLRDTEAQLRREDRKYRGQARAREAAPR